MICQNCGSHLAEGAAFCPQCGTSAAAPNPQAPTITQAAPTGKPLGKKKYLAQAAPTKVKQTVKISTIVMLVAALLVVASFFLLQNTSMFDIPVVRWSSGGESDDVEKEMEDLYDEFLDTYKANKDDMTDKEINEVERLKKSLKKISKNFSISNVRSFFDAAQDLDKDVIGTKIAGDIDEMGDQIDQILGVVNTIAAIFFIIPLLFVLLAGWKKSTGLAVTALIFTCIAQLILSGLLMMLLSLAVNLYQCVLCSNINKAYKSYRRRFAR